MLEGEHSYQRGQENLVPSNNASSAPKSPVIPKDQERPWYIQHFTKLLIGFGLGGAAAALILPWVLWLRCGMSSGSSDQLRLHLLYVTGGIIAVLTLLQTNWKNQGDRLKIDTDIKKNEQDAEKNERDHIRQVHAERRSRYTKAVEQLADEKATVRLGGIYTLVGLVDEWLADDTFNPEERQKEGQVIINNLCSYVRSPFPYIDYRQLFEGKEAENQISEEQKESFLAKRAQFREEQDVRGAIMREIVTRLGIRSFDDIEEEITVEEGPWSDFTYDFSRAYFPYKIDFDDSIINSQLIFSGAVFSKTASFNNSTFKNYVSFEETTFEKDKLYNNPLDIKSVSFNLSVFEAFVSFEKSIFEDSLSYNLTSFKSSVSFRGSIFKSSASFAGSTFEKTASYTDTTFKYRTSFISTLFKDSVYFVDTIFEDTAIFSDATFKHPPSFIRTIFKGSAYFIETIFEKSLDFDKVVFYGPIRFIEKTFNNHQKLQFISFSGQTRFSCQNPPDKYEFKISADGALFETEQVTVADGWVFTIPLGCELFDPEPLPAPKPEEDKTE
jgi:hypothetical protein